MAELTLEQDLESGKLVFRSSAGDQNKSMAMQFLLPAAGMAVILFALSAAANLGPSYISLICLVTLISSSWLYYSLRRHPYAELIFDPQLAILTRTVSSLFGQPQTMALPFREIAALQVLMWGRRFPFNGYFTLIVIPVKGRYFRINEGLDREEIEAFAQKISAVTGVPIKPLAYSLGAP